MVYIPKIYKNRDIQLSMAGSGNPWDYFVPTSKLTLRALYDGYSFRSILELFQISEKDLQEKIDLLVKANLLVKKNGNYYPTFLIADKDESDRTYYHAKRIGKIIADEVIENWEEIVNGYTQLEISKLYSLKDLSFALVGSKLIDIAFLEALVRDRTLLHPAPKRPSPKRKDAQYYFFMIEGDVEYLGQYGEDSMDLPWDNWHFFTFGKNIINGKYNEPPGKIEEKCKELRENNEIENPNKMAEKLSVPILSKEDSLFWKEVTTKIAHKLLLKVKEKEKELKNFYSSLEVSKYLSNSFGEFICWYMHVAYSWAIDILVEKEIIHIPEEKFSSLVIYVEGPQGLLVK